MRIKRSCATIMSLCMAFSLSAVPVAAQEHTEDCYTLKEDCVHTCAEECAEVCEHSCSEESGCLTRELICGQEHLENASALPGEGAMMEEEQNQTPEQSNEGAAAAPAAANAPDAATNAPEGTAAPAGEELQETENVPQGLALENAEAETPVNVPVLLANEAADALKAALETGTDETVTLTENITIDTTLKITRAVTLDLNGCELKMTGSGSVIEVGSSGDLTITDSGTNGTITGGTGMQSGNNICGGGVYISGGKLTIAGGSVTDCSVAIDKNTGDGYAYGGGVYISDGGEFTMTGGSIKDCRATGQLSGTRVYGGGVWIAEGKFTMTGGSIVDCSATNAQYANGGGVGLTGANSQFIMEGGKIDNCEVSDFIGSRGGGVYTESDATFQMSGGSITGCKAQKHAGSGQGDGGGVYVGSSTTFTMSGEAYIGGNTASNVGQDVFNYGTMNANGGTVQGSVYNQSWGTINSGDESTKFEGNVKNVGTINGGEFDGEVENLLTINGGKFYKKVTNTSNNQNTGTISGGEFLGEVTNNNDATTITGGSFAQQPPQGVDCCTVIFKEDNNAAGVSRYVVKGKTVIPPTLTREGYEMRGWHKEGESPAFDFKTGITENITLIADWKAIEYSITVSSSTGGKASADSITANMGKDINLTATPNEGYQFKEWKVTPSSVSIQNNSFTMPASNVTIKAIFEKKPDPTPTPSGGSSGGGSGRTYHKMTFETNGGSTIRVVNAARGDVIDLTKYNPTREGYEFIGWFADAALTQKITEVKLTDNVTVYAGWREIEPIEPETPIEPEKPEISNPFADVQEENWFYEDVLFAYEQGILRGMSANTFAPQMASTRAQIAAIFYRMEDSPAVDGDGSFADVTHGAWFYDAVTWAEQNSILSGYGNGSFGANDPVTREQLAAIFYRYAQFKGLDVASTGDLDAFADKNDTSDWAQTALAWAVESGILSGKGDSRLDPKGTATRAELAAMLHRFAQQTEQ